MPTDLALAPTPRHADCAGQNIGLAALARGAAAGDDAAWTALVTRFTPTLQSVARGFRLNAANVDDVVQATWLAAYTHIGQLREPAAIGSWLVVTARRESFRMLQRGTHELLTDDPAATGGRDPAAPELDVYAADVAAVVQSAVRRLPEHQRRLVETLFAAAAPTHAEASRRLGVPIGSIGPTRERALDRLRRDPQIARLEAERAA